MGLLQIDSVNVVERAHLLTLFSRLGPYDTNLLTRALEERHLFEYWARMASFCPVEDYPLYRYRMERHAEAKGKWIQDLQTRAPGYVDSVLRQVSERGPLTVADLDEPGERTGPWWGWADGKLALEHLFAAGKVSVAHRRNFTRYYDLTERVIPKQHFNAPEVDRPKAQKRLILQAAKALGVGTIQDLVGYYWMGSVEGKQALRDLITDGSIVEVMVDGWPKPAFMDPEATVPRSITARALLNPFDTLVWNRDRIKRIHDFDYRIEIYVPEPKRIYGYYVFPFLLDEDLVARVDLKADRKTGVLRAHGAFLEQCFDPAHVAIELATELTEMARWLGLAEIAVGDKGDLSPHLRKRL